MLKYRFSDGSPDFGSPTRLGENAVRPVPVHSVTEVTAEIIARVGAAQAAKGTNLPLSDLIIGASALDFGYAVGTSNLRNFNRIPGLAVLKL